MTYQETPYQKTNIVDANGNVISSFGGSGGSGGDANQTNQTTQITRETEIRDRIISLALQLPSALVGDRLKVDVPVLSDAPTNTTLTQILAAIKAQINLAATIWTNDSGLYYIRRETVNEGTGAITFVYTDPNGVAANPTGVLRPLATSDRDVVTAFYDVLSSGTGYSVGDLLARVGIIDVNGATPSITVAWLNLGLGTILGTAPVSTSIEPSNENIGARQVGTWSMGINNFPTSFQVSNFPVTQQISNFPATQTINGVVSVSNFPTSFQVSNFPTSFQVSNFPATQQISNFPATQPISGSISVSNFPATQPISATSLPLPSNAATDTMLQQVRDAIKAQINFTTSIFTDNSGAYYIRREFVNEGNQIFTTIFTDLSGNTVIPGVGLRPLASADKDTTADFYDVLVSGTGYSVGDLLTHVVVIDVNSGSPSATAIWINLSLGTILTTAPISANIERANENVGARQIGNWTVALSSADAANLLNLSNAIGAPITGATVPAGGSGLLGWLSAIWKLISDRINPIKGYAPTDTDDTNGYYGFIRSGGSWYIQRITTTSSVTSVRYVTGTTAYTTAWINRTTQTYDYFNNVF